MLGAPFINKIAYQCAKTSGQYLYEIYDNWTKIFTVWIESRTYLSGQQFPLCVIVRSYEQV